MEKNIDFDKFFVKSDLIPAIIQEKSTGEVLMLAYMNKESMKKIITFLKTSNRYKHLVGGLMVGLLGFTPWTAIYATVVAACCLELKDALRGGLWDWIDWGLTVVGGIMSALFWILI